LDYTSGVPGKFLKLQIPMKQKIKIPSGFTRKRQQSKTFFSEVTSRIQKSKSEEVV